MKKVYLLNILMLLLLGGFSAQAQFSESFDAVDTPAGWTITNLGDANTWLFGPPPSAAATYAGAGNAYISYGADAHDDYLITPQITITSGVADQLRFYGRNQSSTFTEEFDLLISVTGTEPADFTDTLASPLAPAFTWEEFVYELTAYDGQDIYIAFHATSTNELRLHIDEVFVEKITTCPQPSELTSSIVSATEVDITWVDNASATEWNVIYGESGFDPETEGTTINDNDGMSSLTLSGLTAETSYDFYVVAVCGAEDESIMSSVASFFTGHCISIPTSSDGAGIGNVTIGGTSFAGTDTTYLNFTGAPVDLAAGESASTLITFLTGYTYGTNIWIDLNDDLTFDESELLFEGESTNANPTTYNASFPMPVDATLGVHRMRIGTADGGQATPNPCYSGSYGVTVDLDVNITEAPTCIAPSELTLGVVTETEATVSWTENGNATEWEITYGESGFDPETEGTTMVDNDGTPGIVISGLTTDTGYDFYVRSICGTDEFSNLSVVGSFFTGYCAYIGSTATRFINNFSTSGGVDNISNLESGFSPNGYGNYTDQVVSQFATGSVGVTVQFAAGTYGCNIFIDWNNDLVFDPATEKVFASGGYVDGVDGTIDVPADAALGNYRMRVVSNWLSTDPTACGANTYGEAEDYTFTVVEAPDCIPPTALIVDAVTFETADISWTENGNATEWEITYGVQGFDPETEGTTVTDSDGTPGTTLIDLTPETAYDFYVTSICGTDNVSNLSVIGTLFTGYCQFFGTDETRYIDNFSTDGGVANISNLLTGDAPSGYANYTDQIVSQFATGIVDFTASFGVGTYGFNIYIDWNDDMAFDEETEKVFASGAYVAAATGSITVPADAVNGDYRMRIVADYLSTNPASCGTSNTGEAEDYTFSVVDAPSCLPTSMLMVESVTVNSADVNWTENGTATEWEVVYGETGFDPATEGTTITDVDGSSGITITGLDDDTEYQFYVRAICSDEDESALAGPMAFRTLCTATDVPYLQDFNSAAAPALPFCTTRENLGDGNEWTTFAQNANGFTSVVLRYAYNTANPANAWFYTQGINLVAGTEYQISYLYGNNSASYSEKMKVSYGTGADAASMVNELADYTDITGAAAAEDVIYFTVDADGVYFFGFNVYSDMNEYYLYVDDIEVKEYVLAECDAPTDVAVSNVTNTSATVTWTESATATDGYTVEVFENGADPETATPVSSETVATGVSTSDASGLEAETAYDVYVTSNCGDEESMSEVFTFTTAVSGIGEINAYGLTYYPNPVKDMLRVSADAPIEVITVYNLVGGKVMQLNPESNDFTIDVSNLAAGSYVVQANVNGSVSTFKLIKD